MVSNSLVNYPKAVLFDWDNTLADTWPTIYESLYKTFTFFNLVPWTFEETRRKVHRSMRDYFPEIFGNNWQKASDIYLEHFKKIHLDNLVPLDGAEEVLKALASKSIYIAVVSNKTGVNLRKEVTHLGWDKYFTKIIGAKDAEEDKPSIKPVMLALEGSKIRPSKDVWFVGDSIIDVECANNTNCQAIFYGHDNLTSEIKNIMSDPVIHFENHNDFLHFINLL